MTAADPTPTPQTSPAAGTKPDAGEPVVTNQDYELAAALSTYPDKRDSYAIRIAHHRQQAVAEATADALRTIVELSDANISAESSRDELAALVVRLSDALKDTQEVIDIVKDFEVGEAEGPCAANRAYAIGLIVEAALISVPATLRDHVVIPRGEYERLKGGVK